MSRQAQKRRQRQIKAERAAATSWRPDETKVVETARSRKIAEVRWAILDAEEEVRAAFRFRRGMGRMMGLGQHRAKGEVPIDPIGREALYRLRSLKLALRMLGTAAMLIALVACRRPAPLNAEPPVIETPFCVRAVLRSTDDQQLRTVTLCTQDLGFCSRNRPKVVRLLTNPFAVSLTEMRLEVVGECRDVRKAERDGP